MNPDSHSESVAPFVIVLAVFLFLIAALGIVSRTHGKGYQEEGQSLSDRQSTALYELQQLDSIFGN